MTETTFPLYAHGWIGLFLVSYAYTSLLFFWSGLVWPGLVFIVLSDFLVFGAKGSGGGWTRHLSLHLFPTVISFISLAIPETGRVIAMSKIYCRSVGGHIGCPFFVSLFPHSA